MGSEVRRNTVVVLLLMKLEVDAARLRVVIYTSSKECRRRSWGCCRRLRVTARWAKTLIKLARGTEPEKDTEGGSGRIISSR